MTITNESLQFVDFWENHGDEKSDTQKFWLDLLHNVLSLEYPERFIEFEKRVALEHVSYIDAYIPSTRTLIEQKSSGINLDRAVPQSDGQPLTPFQQAKRYSDWLPDSERARWIVTCNFQKFVIYDMERPKAPPAILLLSELKHDWHKLSFLIDPKAASPNDEHEVELSVKAGELVGKLYDSLLERYIKPKDKDSLRSLNVFCVRVVFLLYAEDSGLFAKFQFHDYLKSREITARDALRKLFDVLNQRPNERDPYIEADLKAFPYVDGGLFAEGDIEFPQLDGEPLRIIIKDMSEGFDWSGISPTIFGAVFESTLNPETRHSGGMHYTSIENIHKVIDPLFLDALNDEFDAIIKAPASRSRTQKLRAFQKRLGTMKFLDPACGSGNFLTESYLSLRRLENRIINTLAQNSYKPPKNESLIKVSISQFYGIEINDFAVSVARTALWIAESQMWNETQSMDKAQTLLPFMGDVLPLTSYNHIIEANALHMDWRTLVPSTDNLYIMGNPPFLGYSIQNQAQKEDILSVFVDESGKPYKTAGKVDYVAGWYFKAAEFIQNTSVRAAFVSTNSITQGEQVSAVFKTLSERFNIHVDFAHTAFIWNSEAQDKAHVHVVVIGFNSMNESGKLKRLYTPEGLKLVENINFYLVPAPNVFAEPRTKAISKDAPEIMGGNRAADGGNLIIEADDYEEFIRRDPKAKKYIKRYMMGNEFINNITRYCLWLVGAGPHEIRSMPTVAKRVIACRKDRLNGAPDRQKLADTPHLFRETLNPERYLVIPKTSSGNRFYIPMAWLDSSVIPGDELRIIPEANLYHFGILTSRVHMAWVRSVCGRLGMGYRYSITVVYNTFVWPSPNDKQRAKIESTAQKILDVRALYPNSSFADLYDNNFMPSKLKKAHKENDEAVCEAYGWPSDISEDDIVARLFVMYKQLKE
ncbi:MAG: class I SAM-dependent DNA methyltransferase [Synergistaceae bacterium]|nr:class I SAM-dependent DNA methyltransferase [Synergistaceae bacterium]